MKSGIVCCGVDDVYGRACVPRDDDKDPHKQRYGDVFETLCGWFRQSCEAVTSEMEEPLVTDIIDDAGMLEGIVMAAFPSHMSPAKPQTPQARPFASAKGKGLRRSVSSAMMQVKRLASS